MAQKAQNAALGSRSAGNKPSAWSNGPPLSVRGQSSGNNSPAFAGSASRLSGPDFIPGIRGSPAKTALTQASSSPARLAGQANTPNAPAPSSGRESIAPHLRLPPTASPISTSQSTQTSSNGTAKMNAGAVAKSAKHDSNFPCTYDDCGRGFAKEKDLKDHKDEEHEWCRVCKMDFQDFDELLEHKKYSDRHICCLVCGEDFRSEAGRDKHQRQVSRASLCVS